MAVPVSIKMDKDTTKNILVLIISIVVIVGIIVTVFLIRKKIASAIKSNKTSKAVSENNAQNEAIAASSGVTINEVDKARLIAENVAKALNVHVNATWFTYGEDEELAINQLNRINSSNEAVLVSEFYTEESTEGRNIKADLKRYMTKSGLLKINFFNSLR